VERGDVVERRPEPAAEISDEHILGRLLAHKATRVT
jgi:hypothetical protein